MDWHLYLAITALAVSAYVCGLVMGAATERRRFNRLARHVAASRGILGTSEPVGPHEGPLPPAGLYSTVAGVFLVTPGKKDHP